MISSLERTVEQLQETAVGRQEEGYDSPSSGVGSLKVRQEEGYDSPGCRFRRRACHLPIK